MGGRGKISFYHYDFTAQALAKLPRGYDRDIDDVQAMYKQRLFVLEDLRTGLEAIEPELIRFPALDVEVLNGRVDHFIELVERTREGPQL